MSRTLITLKDISLSAPHKSLFSDFTATIHRGDRIALTGRNGSGKTTLLQLLNRKDQANSGTISYTSDTTLGFLPQTMKLEQEATVWEVATGLVVDHMTALHRFEACNKGTLSVPADEYDALMDLLVEHSAFDLSSRVEELLATFDLISKRENRVSTLSGGQQTLLGLVRIMATSPQVLLLDEPTNNLDIHHRKQLYTFLGSYQGAALIVSHDIQLLTTWPRTLWHIEQDALTIFNGSYTHFCETQEQKRTAMHARKDELMQKKKGLILATEAEQRRTAETKRKGIKKYGNDRTARGAAKERAGQTSGRVKGDLNEKREEVNAELKSLFIPEVITPTFALNPTARSAAGIYVREGSVRYGETTILKDLSLAVPFGERASLSGRNGSGKSTLMKAFLNAPEVTRDGDWQLPADRHIGYLDQHYHCVTKHAHAVAAIKSIQPEWSELEIRTHLSTFLFRKNEEVMTATEVLSGGEKARLSLAMIAAQSPSVLLLDEITNNIDIATRQHCIEVLSAFPGTLIMISHDTDFLEQLDCSIWYTVENQTIEQQR